MPQYYRLNEPHVSAEVFDGEVLVINLNTGHYHSIRESGVAIWNLLAEGHSVDAIASVGNAAGVNVEEFVQSLTAAELLVPAESPPAPPAPVETTFSGSPILESYTDMQDLLLIDPIHEVDIHTGWPTKIAETGA
ncbi:MAG: PqqD family protein [Verrucomicrobium sp.]|nr:PqqD family protein [Verrucomicrobium sp.]